MFSAAFKYKYVPQPTATTFAFTSVFILLLCIHSRLGGLVCHMVQDYTLYKSPSACYLSPGTVSAGVVLDYADIVSA